MSNGDLPLGVSREDAIKGLRLAIALDEDFVRWGENETLIDHIEAHGFPPPAAPGVNPLDHPMYPGLCAHAAKLLVSRFDLLAVLLGDHKDARIEAYLAKHNLWGHS